MTDYDFSSGSGTLKIRDLGSTVEFWVRAGYSNFWWDNLRFNTTANGTTVAVEIDYPSGADWKKVTERTVNSSQTVTFRLLTDTNTQSLGGPTTVSRFLDRGTVPDPPSPVTFSSLTSTSVIASFTDGDNGGLAIDARQIVYNEGNNTPYTDGPVFVSSDRSTLITGLIPGKTYYFWARTHNAKGWSGYPGGRSIRMLKVPDAPSIVTLSGITQISVKYAFKDNWNGGVAITARRLAYSTTKVLADATIISAGNSGTLSGLSPGITYYFWASAQNSIGWGPWSVIASAKLIAGAFVIYENAPRPAVPYINVNGVWKVARPMSRNGGYWKDIST